MACSSWIRRLSEGANRAGVYRSGAAPASLLRGLTLAAAIAAAWAVSPRALTAAGPPCELQTPERIVAIGDIHGAYDRFVEALKIAELVDGRLHWSGGRTHLVQTGDVIDRGAESRKALDLLRRLEKEAADAGGAVHQLLGNHEVARMLGDLRLTSPGEYAAFASNDSEEMRRRYAQGAPAADRDRLMKETPLGFVELRIAFGHEGEYGKWLRTLNTVLKINGVLFVHGGISPAVAAMSCGDINDAIRRELTTDIDKTRAEPLQSLAARVDGPLWYRGMPQLGETELDGVLEQQHVRTAVVAHSVTSDARIAVRFGGKLLQIDTGMQPAYVPAGRFSVLEIKHGTFSAIYQDRRDTLFGAAPEAPKHGAQSPE